MSLLRCAALYIVLIYLVIEAEDSRHAPADPEVELRAVWIATVENIDWPTTPGAPDAQQKQQLRDYVHMTDQLNMNAILIQMRPVADALYNSSIEPWSMYLTGEQGLAPSPFWDPLEYLIQRAHPRDIQVYAWLNPFRANMQPNWNGLAPNNVANLYPQYAYPYSSYLWMDPGAQVVQDQFKSVVMDIISRYDVDGIILDDYFYPYPVTGEYFPDNATYAAYQADNGTLSVPDWRRQNINNVIESTYSMIKAHAPSVKFAISPFGMYRAQQPGGMPAPLSGFDPYSQQYADTKLWLQQGWLDVFAPEIYWKMYDPISTSYALILDWWVSVNNASKTICAANAVYKMEPSYNWSAFQIQDQIEYSREPELRAGFSLGNALYSATWLKENYGGIADVLKLNVYQNKSVPPQ